MKASDVPELAVLQYLATHGTPHSQWNFTWDVANNFSEFPPKVVAAKLRQLLKRHLVDGCPCGCRGDWTLTEAGRAALSERAVSATQSEQ